MKGQAYINGKDIWLTWGAKLWKGTYEKLLKPPPMKDYIRNSSRMEHGDRVIANSDVSKTAARELSLQFLIEGSSENDYLVKYTSFVSELEKGALELKIPKLNTTFKLVYIDCSSYGYYGKRMGKFTVKFEEPNTKDRKTLQ